MRNQDKGLATLDGGAIERIGGLDATVRTNLDLALHLLERTAMAVTMARMDVAETRWRLPSVPREADELPFPTDRTACGSSIWTRGQGHQELEWPRLLLVPAVP